LESKEATLNRWAWWGGHSSRQ